MRPSKLGDAIRDGRADISETNEQTDSFGPDFIPPTPILPIKTKPKISSRALDKKTSNIKKENCMPPPIKHQQKLDNSILNTDLPNSPSVDHATSTTGIPPFSPYQKPQTRSMKRKAKNPTNKSKKSKLAKDLKQNNDSSSEDDDICAVQTCGEIVRVLLGIFLSIKFEA